VVAVTRWYTTDRILYQESVAELRYAVCVPLMFLNYLQLFTRNWPIALKIELIDFDRSIAPQIEFDTTNGSHLSVLYNNVIWFISNVFETYRSKNKPEVVSVTTWRRRPNLTLLSGSLIQICY
jgi:hypothetical protein